MSRDRIEKKILLRAPRKRVWRALTDSQEFGSWFGMKFDAQGRLVGGAPPASPAEYSAADDDNFVGAEE